MSLSTEYKGWTCSYSENQDTWGCHELEFWGCATLTALKRKIDVHERRKRKLAETIPAYRINHDGKVDEVFITVIAEKEVVATHSFQRGVTPGAVWVVRETPETPKHYAHKERSKEKVSDLIPHTPENLAMIRELGRLKGIAEAARKAAQTYSETIPRFTYSAIVDAGVTIAEAEDA
jgi:hypothetical protein